MIFIAMDHKFKIQNSRQRGQALLEILVALAIGVIIATAFVTLGVVSVRNSSFSRNQVSATKLAQEGIEAMISIRDQDTVGAVLGNGSNDQWSKLVVNSSFGLSCLPDPTQTCSGDFQLSACTLGSIPQRCISKTSTPEVINTIFSRKIQITDAGTNVKNVTAIVWWSDGQGLHKSVLSRKLQKEKLE